MHPKGLIAALTTVIAIGLVFNELPVVFGHEHKDHDVLVQGGHVRVKRQGGAGAPPPPPASGEIDVTTATTTNAHDQTTLITSSNEITSATDNPPDEPTADESDSSDNDTDSESATDPAVTVASTEFTDNPSEATTENSGEQSPSDPPDPDTESTVDPEFTDDSNSTDSIDEPDETTAVGSEEQVTSPQTIEPDINIDLENDTESSNTSLSATTELNDSIDEATVPNSSGERETTIITDQEETDDESETPVAPELTIEIDVNEAPDNPDETIVPNSGSEQVLSTTQSGLNPPPASNESTAVESVAVEREFDDDDDNATTVIDDTSVPSPDTDESASGETSPPDQEPQLTSGEQPSTDAPEQTDLHLETEVDFSATTVPDSSGEEQAGTSVLPLDENPVESTTTTAQSSAQLGPTNHQNLDGTELTTEQPAASEENVAGHETSASPSIEAEDSAIERPNVEPIPDVDLPEEETDAESDEGSNSGKEPTEDGISVDVTQNPIEVGAGNVEVGGEAEVTTLSDAITQPPRSDGIEQQTTPSTGETSNESIIDAQNDKPGPGSEESTESPNVEVPTQNISVDDDDVLASVVATTVRVPENSDQVPETSREDTVTRQPDAGSGEDSSEDEQSVRPATTTTEETTTTTTKRTTTTRKQVDATTTAAEEKEESLFSKHKYAIIGGAAAVALAAGAVALVNKQAIMQALNMNNVSPQLANPYEGLPMSATSADMMLPQLV